MPITIRGESIRWDDLYCCKDCFFAYGHYLLRGTSLHKITPTRTVLSPTTLPSLRSSLLRDHDHLVFSERPLNSLILSRIATVATEANTYVHRNRRRIPSGYIEINGRPCLELSANYMTSISHPRHVPWFPPHVILGGGRIAVRLPEWSRAPLGPFLSVEEVFELARRKGRVREKRRYVALLVALPTLAMICFVIFLIGDYLLIEG